MKYRVFAIFICGVAWVSADVVDCPDKALPLSGDGRAELARELFEPLSFNLGDYFFVQEDLKKYISELSVRNSVWDELKWYHDNHDYLGMLGVLSGEKLRDYPSEKTIRRLHAMLIESSPFARAAVHFQLSVSLTRKMNIVCRAFPGKDTGILLGNDFKNFSWQFKIKGGKCFYIYSPDNRINVMIKQYGDARDKVREDMKMARIFKEDGEKQIAELCERQYNDTLRWLATAKVVAFAACEVCKGEKTVPEEMICNRCNGVGRVVQRSWIKDLSGNPLPARKVTCVKCYGKGVIIVGRKPCEACDGKGRLPKRVERILRD